MISLTSQFCLQSNEMMILLINQNVLDFNLINICMISEEPLIYKLQNYLSRRFLELGREWDEQKREKLKKALAKQLKRSNNLQPYFKYKELKDKEIQFAFLNNQACEQYNSIKTKHDQHQKVLKQFELEEQRMKAKILQIAEHDKQLKKNQTAKKQCQRLKAIIKQFESDKKQQAEQRESLDNIKQLNNKKIQGENQRKCAHEANIGKIQQDIDQITKKISKLTKEKRKLEKQLRQKDEQNLRRVTMSTDTKGNRKISQKDIEFKDSENPSHKLRTKEVIISRANESFSKKIQRYGLVIAIYIVLTLYMIVF